MYPVTRDPSLDFLGESYGSVYPNIHKYPATMLPQIGMAVLNRLNLSSGAKLLDPYCGSGSSFASALDSRIDCMHGYDINPLARLITKVKFTEVTLSHIQNIKVLLKNEIEGFVKSGATLADNEIPMFTNIHYWYAEDTINSLSIIRKFIREIKIAKYQNFFLLPFSETVRICSFTRKNGFKLHKMKEEDINKINIDPYKLYFEKLDSLINIYEQYYYPKLSGKVIEVIDKKEIKPYEYNVVLTSPPYGDSTTTVAYGQFSLFSNAWMGFNDARKVDKSLMGGNRVYDIIKDSCITMQIKDIAKQHSKRALEVSSFYKDLAKSIHEVSTSIQKKGFSVYIVGNRTVKGVQLRTDQFIAEKFEENNFRHIGTYKRKISNKTIPIRNSPSNKPGHKQATMTEEYIVVSQKSA